MRNTFIAGSKTAANIRFAAMLARRNNNRPFNAINYYPADEFLLSPVWGGIVNFIIGFSIGFSCGLDSLKSWQSS